MGKKGEQAPGRGSATDNGTARRSSAAGGGVEELGYARVDLDRKRRQGASEVVFAEGKTVEQIAGITRSLLAAGQEPVLITRMDARKAEELARTLPLDYHADAGLGIVGEVPKPDGKGTILIVTGGTSDIPVAEEAALTAEVLGNKVERVFDAGVSGVHRLLAEQERISSARVIVAVAGMEGALPSVVGGLAKCPVIAVPTSVGYGASFGGVAALLGMLNSCASGVSVVNIDNGFGAGYQASMINHL